MKRLWNIITRKLLVWRCNRAVDLLTTKLDAAVIVLDLKEERSGLKGLTYYSWVEESLQREAARLWFARVNALQSCVDTAYDILEDDSDIDLTEPYTNSIDPTEDK